MLDEVLSEARRGTLPGTVRTGATFVRRRLRRVVALDEHERDCKRSRLAGYFYTTHLLNRAFGDERIEDITARTLEQ